MSIRIQELAVPKGSECPICEICGQKATTKCESCKFTHYCSEYHKNVDFKSFHPSVCKTIAYIRKEHSLPFTEKERRVSDNILLSKKREIQLLAEITARKWLLEENAELAYPAAMSAFNIAKDLNGLQDIGMVYPTCLVSECYLRLGDLKTSQEYMILANWVSQRYDLIPPTSVSRLQRLVGLICMKTGKWERAREAFAENLYAVAIEHGTSNMSMAVAYGLLGLTLLHFGKEQGAFASFHKMSDQWLRYLLTRFELKAIRCATFDEMVADEKTCELEFQYLESKIIFMWIYEAVRKLGMNMETDLINFKILCVQVLHEIRDGCPEEATVYKHEALATAIRTKQDKAIPKDMVPVLIEVLGGDYLMLWEKKHNRPRTVATKYLEMIKAINI